MKRRAFLQRSGLALAALGLSEAGLSILTHQYQKVLAEPTRRKLALLVGINQYRTAPLSGCLTDVELQQELLMHRFGFQPQDILTLTDQQATRDAIATAFVSHLTEQAQPGDVVVFHFSGYGSSVSLDGNETQTSLVTIDEPVQQQDVLVVRDLLEDTLLLLLQSLATDKVTTILDTSYTAPAKPLLGSLRVRTRPPGTPVQPDVTELDVQEQLLSRKGIDSPQDKVRQRDRLGVQRRSGQFPGVLLAAAEPGRLATEARWSGFNAGLLTYALTQQLWQTTAPTTLRVCFGRVREQVEQLAGPEQKPQLGGQKGQEPALQPYHLPTIPDIGADGVVTAIDDKTKTVYLWLGGLPLPLLEQYGAFSLLSLADSHPTPLDSAARWYLQVVTREGLTAKARIYASDASLAVAEAEPAVQVGQFVREQVRVLPRNIGLTVALDSSLARIERVDAISALSTIPRVSSAVAGEQAADYLFSKIQVTVPTQVATLPTANLPSIVANSAPTSQSTYGLFSPGQDTIPNTIGEGGEAVKVAVRRLVPKFQTLLAAKLLNLTLNQGSSGLAVRAVLEGLDPQAKALMRRETAAIPAKSNVPPASTEAAGLLNLPIGSRIQYRLENYSDRPLYFLLLSLDSSGNLVFLNAPPVRSPEPAETQPDPAIGAVAAGGTLTLPQASTAFQWILNGPTGLVETYLLCSQAPFTQTLTTLETVLRPAGNVATLHTLSNPLEVAQSVLQDLHQASDPAAQTAAAPTDTFALDVNAWANLHFVYQLV